MAVRCDLSSQENFRTSSCVDGLKVVSLDLVDGQVLWGFVPKIDLDLPAGYSYQVWAKLLKLKTVPTRISLVVSVSIKNAHGEDVPALSNLYIWNIDSQTGATSHNNHKSLRRADNQVTGASGVIGAMSLTIRAHVETADHPHSPQYMLVRIA